MSYNSCLFEQLPVFNQFNLPVYSNQQCQMRKVESKKVYSAKIEVERTQEGLLLTLKKPLEANIYKNAIQSKLMEIREKYANKPKYSLVSDYFNNQYYVDNSANIQREMIEEMKQLDTKMMDRKLAKDSFKDYELELNYNGETLVVQSNKDDFFKELKFNQAVEDFYINNCTIEDEQFSVLKVGIILNSQKNITAAAPVSAARPVVSQASVEDNLSKLINWAQENSANADFYSGRASPKNETKKIQKRKDQEERIKKEQANRDKQEKARRVQLLKQQKLEEKKQRRAIEEQRKREQVRLAEQVRQKEAYEQRLVEEQRIQVQQMIREQQRAQEAQIQYARKQELRQQRAQEEQIRYVREQDSEQKRVQVLREQQAYQRQLVEEDRIQKAQKELERKQRVSSPKARPTSVAVESDCDDSDMDVDSDAETSTNKLRKFSSPVLEDVDDAELHRYNESIKDKTTISDGPVILDI